jgi:outer membrane protein OmpA-like peptidoglycan-associated protein/osmotically-inducible protein OsmY
MANWRRWLRSGLVATVVLALLAFFVRSGAIERELTTGVAERLVAQGQDWAAISVSGRDVVLSGTAPSTEAVESAVALAANVPGVRGVTDETTLLAIASPYVWTAERAGRLVTLSGNVPSEAARNALLVSARRVFPDAEIQDGMSLARGAPASFGPATRFVLDRLAGMSTGTLTITDGTLSGKGTASDTLAYHAAQQAFQVDAPRVATLGPVELSAPRADPFVWSVAYDGKAVTFDGYVPNEVVRETLVAAAKATLAGAPVVDKTEIASGEPEGFAEAASYAVNVLGRLDNGGITLDGLNIDVAGVARTVDDYEDVLASLANLPGGARVVSNNIKPAEVSPYGWAGERDDNGVVLTGYVPSLDGRAAMAAAASALFPGVSVTDRVRVAGGEPKMDWLGGVKFAMGELAKLSRGRVSLGNRTFAVKGEAATPEAFADLLEATGKTLPASLELDSADVTPPRVSPYRFVADLAGAQVHLTGYAPSQKIREDILDTAQRKFGKVEIVDDLVYGSGAPDGFTDAVSVALQAVARLGSGHAEIADHDVAVSGSAWYPSAADELVSATEDALPKGYKAEMNIVTRQEGQPVTPVRCRDLLQVALQRGRIEFATNKPEITGDSFGLLDRVAATIERCPDAKIEVAAHTDSAGSAARNRDLTQSRAEAIVDYLVDAGVKRERLSAVGYGESRPVADNGSADGKAANRRVEFTVELPEGG